VGGKFATRSDVPGAGALRELLPRAARSPGRAFYARVGNTFIVAYIRRQMAREAMEFVGG